MKFHAIRPDSQRELKCYYGPETLARPGVSHARFPTVQLFDAVAPEKCWIAPARIFCPVFLRRNGEAFIRRMLTSDETVEPAG